VLIVDDQRDVLEALRLLLKGEWYHIDTVESPAAAVTALSERDHDVVLFEETVFHIERGDLLDILEHPNPERYSGQRIFVVRREDSVYLVPFVEDEHAVFLKMIIPSRKATKEYLREESHED